MQNNSVYSAASITDVINMLKQYRLSGVLTIRRASHPYAEEVRVNVELGQPLQLRQGTHEERFTNAAFIKLQGWGMIYFMFQAIDPTFKLPPPQRTPQAQPAQPTNTPPVSYVPHMPVPAQSMAESRAWSLSSPAVTRPLPAISPQMAREQSQGQNTRPLEHHQTTAAPPNTPIPSVATGQNTPPDYSSLLLFNEPLPQFALEMAIASLTPAGKNYPIAHIPRYDRMIYLLINGQRSIADLTQLTRRSIDEICNSLYRLKQQELIFIRI